MCGAVCRPAGKKRRLTLTECGNDINSMMDMGKITDMICCVHVCMAYPCVGVYVCVHVLMLVSGTRPHPSVGQLFVTSHTDGQVGSGLQDYVNAVFRYMLGLGCVGVHVDIFMCGNYGYVVCKHDS